MPTRETAPNGAPCWIELFTSDTDKARAFYGELFGWTSEEAGPEYGGYINFSKDGVQVAGCMKNDGSQGMPDVWTTYLATDDIAKTVEASEANGGVTHLAPMQVMDLGSMALVADAGGAAIGLWQPGTHKGFGVLGEPGTPCWFELHTRDYNASVAFYRNILSWDTHTQGDTDEFRYTTLGEGDGQLAGIMDATAFLPDGMPAHWAIYFGTDDADATVAKAVELGATVVQPAMDTPYGRLASLTDPTGTLFKLVQDNT